VTDDYDFQLYATFEQSRNTIRSSVTAIRIVGLSCERVNRVSAVSLSKKRSTAGHQPVDRSLVRSSQSFHRQYERQLAVEHGTTFTCKRSCRHVLEAGRQEAVNQRYEGLPKVRTARPSGSYPASGRYARLYLLMTSRNMKESVVTHHEDVSIPDHQHETEGV